jgi:uncharacterized protein (TIGR03085 family)
LKKRTPYPELIQLIRTGPPKLSVFGLPGADEKLNLVEYFVHHEDTLRAQPDWKPREISPDLADVLWARLGMARLMMRKAPVGVELVRADDSPSGNGRVRITAKARTPVVTVTGTPAELTMWTMGRRTAADVRLDGSDSDVAALRSPAWQH